jgi:hypothetical protein
MNRMPLALSHPLETARTRAAAVPLAAHCAPFLRAMTRKPSCLISCNQRSSRGRSRAFVGRHGGTNPTGSGYCRQPTLKERRSGSDLLPIPLHVPQQFNDLVLCDVGSVIVVLIVLSLELALALDDGAPFQRLLPLAFQAPRWQLSATGVLGLPRIPVRAFAAHCCISIALSKALCP